VTPRTFETVNSLGFSPDDVVYDPGSNHLFISAAGAGLPFDNGIFETTVDGGLVRHIRLEDLSPGSPFTGALGFSITLATNGPKAGHFFMVETLGQTGVVHEFDADWKWVDAFPVKSSYEDAHPGDGIAYNPTSMDLLVAEEVHGDLIEVTTGGVPVRSLPDVQVQGITFSQSTGTYFGVNTNDELREISTDGKVLQVIDLTPYGITRPVGVATDGTHLFVADEGDSANTGGHIYVINIPPTAAPAPTAAPTTSSFAGSVPTPAQITLDPVIVAESAAIAAGVLIFVPFPGILFNRTIEENYAEISEWVRRARRRLGRRGRLGALLGSLPPWARRNPRPSPTSTPSEPPPSATDPEPDPGTQGSFWRSPRGIALFLAVSTLLYGFLDPTFGLNLRSLATLAGVAIGLAVTLLAFCLPRALSYRSKAIPFSISALPAALPVGIACVLLTRLTNFQPGYLYGLIVAVVVAREVSVAVEGKAMAMAATSTFVVAVVAWFGLLWADGLGTAGEEPGLPIIALQTAFVMAVVAGVELTAFGMLPLRFLPGERVYRWNRRVWAALIGLGLFGFAHVLMNPRDGYMADSSRTPLITIVGLLIFFGLSSVLFWAYFRLRTRPVAPAAG
jgi:hypothetical protein